MRISDWSSDVCSSDLNLPPNRRQARSHVRFCTDLCAEGTSRLAKGKDRGMTANSFDARSVLSAGGRDHEIYRLDVLGDDAAELPYRSAEVRVGQECGSTCRSRGWPIN